MVKRRTPQVRYWASKGAYMCEYQGKQRVLCRGAESQENYQAALNEYTAMICGQTSPAETAAKQHTYQALWDAFVADQSSSKRATTIALRERYILPFLVKFGQRLVSHVLPHEILTWLAEMRKERKHPRNGKLICWKDGSIRNFWHSVNRLCNWGVKTKLISDNPVKGQEVPSKGCRGEICLILPEHHAAIMAHEKNVDWREYFICLQLTGCRPGEMANATSSHYDSDRQALVFTKRKKGSGEFNHKTSGKGKDRVIYLTGEALAIVKRRVAERKGALFGFSGKQVANKFTCLQKATGLRHLIAYGYRHSFCTEWLLQNRSIDVLAILVGTSVQMITDHYSHLVNYKQELRHMMFEFNTSRICAAGGTVPVKGENGVVECHVGLMEPS